VLSKTSAAAGKHFVICFMTVKEHFIAYKAVTVPTVTVQADDMDLQQCAKLHLSLTGIRGRVHRFMYYFRGRSITYFENPSFNVAVDRK
jgi:hypothetical protein